MHEKQQLLEIHHIKSRADLLMQLLQRELQFAELKNKLTNKTKTELDKQQREYFLQQQMKSIKDELGGDTNERELKEMQKKAETKKWPAAAKDLFRKGIERLERAGEITPEQAHDAMVNEFGVYSDRESKRSPRRKSVLVILLEQSRGDDLDRGTG